MASSTREEANCFNTPFCCRRVCSWKWHYKILQRSPPKKDREHDNLYKQSALFIFWVYILLTVPFFIPNLQICHEFERFSTYLTDIKVAVFYGGVNIKTHKDLLKNECPHIVVGTPGRILALARDKDLSLRNVRHFILDECDKMLESLGMLGLIEII